MCCHAAACKLFSNVKRYDYVEACFFCILMIYKFYDVVILIWNYCYRLFESIRILDTLVLLTICGCSFGNFTKLFTSWRLTGFNSWLSFCPAVTLLDFHCAQWTKLIKIAWELLSFTETFNWTLWMACSRKKQQKVEEQNDTESQIVILKLRHSGLPIVARNSTHIHKTMQIFNSFSRRLIIFCRVIDFIERHWTVWRLKEKETKSKKVFSIFITFLCKSNPIYLFTAHKKAMASVRTHGFS